MISSLFAAATRRSDVFVPVQGRMEGRSRSVAGGSGRLWVLFRHGGGGIVNELFVSVCVTGIFLHSGIGGLILTLDGDADWSTADGSGEGSRCFSCETTFTGGSCGTSAVVSLFDGGGGGGGGNGAGGSFGGGGGRGDNSCEFSRVLRSAGESCRR